MKLNGLINLSVKPINGRDIVSVLMGFVKGS